MLFQGMEKPNMRIEAEEPWRHGQRVFPFKEIAQQASSATIHFVVLTCC